MVHDFRLGNKKLSNFGGVILSQEADIDTVQLLNTTEDNNSDGQILFGSRYSPREFVFSIYFENGLSKEKARELTAWIMKKDIQELEFFGDERYENLVIDVIYTGALNIANYGVFNVSNSINLSFTAYDPYWRFKNEEKTTINNPVLLTNYPFIENKSNVVTYPTLMLKPLSKEVRILWYVNEKDHTHIVLKDLDLQKEYYLDFRETELYHIENGKKVNDTSKFSTYDENFVDDYFENLKKTEYVDCNFQLFNGKIKYVHIYPNGRLI